MLRRRNRRNMKIKKEMWLGIAAAVALPLLSVCAQQTPPPAPPTAPPPPASAPAFSPNVAEVVRLTQSGLGEDVVIGFVGNSKSVYKLSSNDIIALKDAGVSGPVIAAMLNHDTWLQNAPPPPPSSQQKLYAPAPSTAPGQPTPNSSSISQAPTVPNAPTITSAPGGSSNAAAQGQPGSTPPATVVEQSPPPPQVEVMPVAPGPNYYWVPGYWTWNGTWVWVGGRYAVRPWHGAVWVGGHWSHHGRSYVWVGGGWH